MENATDPIESIVNACKTPNNEHVVAVALRNAAKGIYVKDLERLRSEFDRIQDIEAAVKGAFEECFCEAQDDLKGNTSALRILSGSLKLIDVNAIVSDIADTWLDSLERDRDPYAYYGVRPSDFF